MILERNKQSGLITHRNKIFLIGISLATLLLGIGYAQLTHQTLFINADADVEPIEDVVITSVTSSNISIPVYTSNSVNSTVTLDPSNPADTASMTITVYNNSNVNQYFLGTTVDSGIGYTNSGIVYTITGLDEEELIEPGESKTFTVTFSYKDGQLQSSNTLTSFIQYNFSPLSSMTFTANNSPAATYTGAALTPSGVTVSTPSSGVEIKYGTTEGTYDSSNIPTFTEVGTHTVYYQIKAEGYLTERGSYTFTIEKATPVITLSANTGTVVEGNTMTFTATVSSGATSGNVTGTLSVSSGTTTVATISPASSNITATPSGFPTTITVTGVTNGTSTITVGFTPGDTSNYNTPTSVTYTANIVKSATIPTAENYCQAGITYTGASQTLTNLAGTGYTFSGNTGMNVGDYTVIATLAEGYRWSDNDTGTKSFTCSISPLEITVTATNQSKVYNGSALSANATCSVTAGTLVEGHTVTCTNTGSRTNVGTSNKVLSTVVIKDSNDTDVSSNYAITKVNGKLYVNNAKITFNATTNGGTLSGVSPLYAKSGATVVYTAVRGTTEGTIPTASKEGNVFMGWYTAASGGSKVLDADGTFTGVAVSGYTTASAWATTANKTLYAQYKISTSIPTNTLCVNRTYTGIGQNLTSVTSGTGYTLSNYNQTNAGEYTITATLTDGYAWSDGTTGSKTFACTMNKATPVITLSSTSGEIIIGHTGDFVATVSSGSPAATATGTLSASSSDVIHATVSPTSSNITANMSGVATTETITGISDGTSTITISFVPADTTNFNNAADKTYSVLVISPTLTEKIIMDDYGSSNYDAAITAIQNKSARDFSITATTDEGLHAIEDYSSVSSTTLDGTSYYFRGAVEDNWVSFAGYLWRVVRINGDGSVRMIYSGTPSNHTGTETIIGTSQFNYWRDSIYYIGYTYYDSYSRIQRDSAIKRFVDNWYENNLKSGYENYLANEIFCNDRSSITDDYYKYGASIRQIPSLICTNKYDRYTLKISGKSSISGIGDAGNNLLDYPIGLLTLDELRLSGDVLNPNSSSSAIVIYPYVEVSNSYLQSGIGYWLSSPSFLFYDAHTGYITTIFNNTSSNLVDSSSGVRPVINLRSTVKYAGGIGTVNDPYIVKQEPTMTLSASRGGVSPSGTTTFTATIYSGGVSNIPGTLTVRSSDLSKVTVSPSSSNVTATSNGTDITITVTGVALGDSTLTVEFVPADSGYGTISKTYVATVRNEYVITFDANGGNFVNNSSTNTLVYLPNYLAITDTTVTKYSHTSNVDDTGLQIANYEGSCTNANIAGTDRGDPTKAHVITIPGATSLTVDIYYKGQGTDYGWATVWEGSHPDYSAGSDYYLGIYGGTKLGGSQSGSYTVNGNSLTNMGYSQFTISGDTVTFGFYSSYAGISANNYGYYAIVTNNGPLETVTYSGEYREPIKTGYTFVGWLSSEDGKIYKTISAESLRPVDNVTYTAQWGISVSKPSSSYCQSGLQYTGSSQILTKVPATGYSFSDNTGVNAGSYTITAKLDNGYVWADGTLEDSTFTCSISKITVSTTAPTTVSETLTYTGNAQELLSSPGACTNGTMYWYTSNPSRGESTPEFDISNGWTTTAPATYTGLDAGTYNIYYYCYVSDTTNYQGSNINTVSSVSKTIDKIIPVITLSSSGGTMVVGNTATFMATVTSSVSSVGVLAVSSDTTSVATVSPASANVTAITSGVATTITVTGVSAGNSYITVSFIPTDTTNYDNASSVTYSVFVAGANQCISGDTLGNCLIYNDYGSRNYSNAIANINSKTASDFSSISTTYEGLKAIEDYSSVSSTTLDGTSYYYRGVVENNWVSFAGYLWKVVRINGDGSVRMIYSGTASNHTGAGTQIGTSSFNSGSGSFNYTYVSSGTEIDSTIKGVIDNWYETNIKQGYESYLSNEIFCNDRSGYVYYGAFSRLHTNNAPSLVCINQADRYTLKESGSSKIPGLSGAGNNKLNYPIGLLTADEASLAGGKYETANQSYYLSTGLNYWLGSPSKIIIDTSTYHGFYMSQSHYYSSSTLGSYYGVRPVINLKSTVKYAGGIGTVSDPYVVKQEPTIYFSSSKGGVSPSGTTTFTATIYSGGMSIPGTITVSSSNPSKATVSSSSSNVTATLSGTDITITVTGVALGDSTITVTFIPTDVSYGPVSRTYTITTRNDYTITFDANTGTFANSSSTNTLVYPVDYLTLSSTTITKYSHTSNVNDTGLKISNYGNNWTNANITGTDRGDTSKAHVVTIPGANSLTVDVYYNGQNSGSSYDFATVWAGSHPDYTAAANYNLGVPDGQRLGGSQSGSYTVNGNTLTNMGYSQFTISGDTVTFGFRSNASGYGQGYGYYAIITNNGPIESVMYTGTYEEPTKSGYTFLGWLSSDDGNIYNNITGESLRPNDDVTYTAQWGRLADIPTYSTHCRSGLKYTGSSQVLTNSPGTGYSFSGNTGINAGSYTVTATLDSGYIWSDGTTEDRTFTCSIGKATVSVTAPTTVSNTLAYTGNEQELLATPGSCTNGTMYWYTSNPVYSYASPTFDLSDGWTTTAPTTYTGVNAGTYYMYYYCYVDNTDNYQGSNFNAVKYISKAINKITPVITLSSESGNVVVGNTTTFAATVTSDVASIGTLGVSSISTSLATVSPSSSNVTAITSGVATTITITGVSKGSNTINLYFTPTDTTNFNSASSKTYTVTVIGSNQCINGDDLKDCLIYNDYGSRNYNDAITAISNKQAPDFSYTSVLYEGLRKTADYSSLGASFLDGTSYYYRGAVNDNWVSFAGYLWRIVRINGDGSIRLIYSGTTSNHTGDDTQIGTSAYNSNYNDPKYIGYMYDTNTNSTIKGVIDSWYESNIQTGYEGYLSNGIFCNDRSISKSDTSYNYYGAYTRLSTNKKLECSNDDRFTLKLLGESSISGESGEGNNLLSYPIGLLTTDEVELAGGKSDTSNQKYYLYTGKSYWLGSPAYSSINGSYSYMYYNGSSISTSTTSSNYGIRPVINLKSSVKYASGSGFVDDPYILKQQEPSIIRSEYNSIVSPGNTKTFTATVYSGGTLDISGTLTVSSSNAGVATVSPASSNIIATEGGTVVTITISGVTSGNSTITLTFTPSEPSYNATSATHKTIIADGVVIPTASDYCKSGLIYTGQTQLLTNTAGTGYTFSGNSGTNAGDYTVTATLNSGYAWLDYTTGPKTFVCGIDKVTPTITMSATEGSIKGTGTTTFTATITSDVTGVLSVSSNPSNVVTVSPASSNIGVATSGVSITETITGVASGISTLTLTFTPSDTTNYNIVDDTYVVDVSFCEDDDTLADCLIYNDTGIRNHNNAISMINNKSARDFSTIATTDEGLHATADYSSVSSTNLDGTSYYFRGAVEDNWVSFAGYLWRVVRINGDGSVRMIYSGTASNHTSTGARTGTSAYNSSRNNTIYVGYMYNTTSSSTIKSAIDSWYVSNLKSSYEGYLSNEIFCNDRSGSSSAYGAYTRLVTNKAPSLLCTNQEDRYTLIVNGSSSIHGTLGAGNNKLNYPIGLLTADEVSLAGGTSNQENRGFYLYIGTGYWLGSPAYYNSGAYVFEIHNYYGFTPSRVDNTSGIRPVINLNSTVKWGSGNGTENSPYTVSL